MLKLAWRRPQTTVEPDAPAELVATMVAEHLRDHGGMRWRARGRSMQPAIRDGETVPLRPTTDVRPGDVVLAYVRLSDQLVLHRVRAVHGDELELRGDACRLTDPPVRASDVLGVVDPCPDESAYALAYRVLP
jgi:Peptidase S24-like